MFARIIPSLRTPRHVACFDYKVPEGLVLTAGDVVQVPFRSKSIMGVVQSLSETSALADKAKDVHSSYGGLRLSSATLAMLERLALHSFSSPASVLHAWLGTLPKKAPPALPIRAVAQSSLLPPLADRLLVDHLHATDGVIDLAQQEAAQGRRVLILTPWTQRADYLAQQLHVTALTSDLAMGKRFRAWSSFMRGETDILVATRLGAWLATEADLVIIDEPENDDHKQDELAPRYDARWIADQAASLGSRVTRIGLTPRLSSISSEIPLLQPELNNIDIHRADWSPVATLQQRSLTLLEDASERPRFIIHPIYGERARLRCADCAWTAVCGRCGGSPSFQNGQLICHRCGWKGEALAACPACQGLRLTSSRAGRDLLARQLRERGINDVEVLSLGEWYARAEFPQKSLIIVTDLSLLAGGTEDVRRRERLITSYRRLADMCVRAQAALVVQSEPQLLVESRDWLTNEGCHAALKKEYAERVAFKLPPAARLVKFIVRGSRDRAEQVARRLRAGASEAEVNGPYAVERLPGSRMPRSVIHLTCPSVTTDEKITAFLEPLLADDILVDLDPVAFFE